MCTITPFYRQRHFSLEKLSWLAQGDLGIVRDTSDHVTTWNHPHTLPPSLLTVPRKTHLVLLVAYKTKLNIPNTSTASFPFELSDSATLWFFVFLICCMIPFTTGTCTSYSFCLEYYFTSLTLSKLHISIHHVPLSQDTYQYHVALRHQTHQHRDLLPICMISHIYAWF